MMMRNCFKFLFILVIGFASCNEVYKGDGPAIVQKRDVGEIRRIAINMNATVTVYDTSASFCNVTAQEDIQNGIVARMDGHTLVIGTKGTLMTDMPVEIEIGMIRPEGIEVNGSAAVTAMNTLKNDKIELEVNGSGVLNLDMVANKARSYVSGSGIIRLTGSAQEHKIEISGSGQVDGFGFKTLKTGADISGSGRSNVFASEQLNAQVSGSGNVIYMGTPNISKSISGSGTVSAAP
ncbi:MAG TPA: head GIN domain-containing protein [Bacteroidia bacterium]|nr:head GIN domain-containing protein [Bacteroidia bacterium]